jgi:poly(3-hydroxybutyrate) depolymerase
MPHQRPSSRLIVLLSAFLLTVGSCGSSGSGTTGGEGGSNSSGGATGSGGTTGTGGSPGSGGTTGSGGAKASGGTTGSGGVTGTGGTTGSGGSGTGGVAGNPGSGGHATGGNGGSIGSGGHAGGAGGAAAGASGTGGKGGAAGSGTGGAGTGVAGGSGAGGVTAMSSGCGKAPTISSSMYNNGTRIPITAANLQRRYILNVPKNYDDTKAYRLVIAFHQRDGNDVQMYDNGYYHLMPLDTNNTTIFVAPNGQQNGAPCTGTGNGDSGCGWPNPNNSDFALADAVVAQVEENFCVDTNRIFATGWSYGGAMSYETSCARPLSGGGTGYIRAIAVYSGSPQITAGPCPPSKPVAYYASHGTADTVLQYSGGVTMAQDYAMTNGCTWTTPTMVTSGNHVCTNETGCMSGYPVEFCSFNGPHTPDPTDSGQSKSWEYQNVWNFFNQF